MPQNNDQVQWDSKPDTSGLSASQSSGIQWDSKPDVSQLPSGKPDISKSLFDPANKGVNALDYSAAYSAAHPSPPQPKKGFFRSAGEEVWNAVTSPFTSQPSGFMDEPMATPTGVSNRVQEFKNNPVGSLGRLAADVGMGAVAARFMPEFEDTNAPTPIRQASVPDVVAPAPEAMNAVRRIPGQVPREQVGGPQRPIPQSSVTATGNRELPGGGMLLRPSKLLSAGTSEASVTRPQSLLLQPEAPSTPNTAMRSPMANLNDILDQQMGVQKLKPNLPLREQVQSGSTSTEVPIHRNPMEAANGKAIYDAANGNPETLQALHNLTRVDIRQALINSGEDMGQITVSDSKYAGKSSISREASFNRLLAKGYSPEEIIKLAKGGN